MEQQYLAMLQRYGLERPEFICGDDAGIAQLLEEMRSTTELDPDHQFQAEVVEVFGGILKDRAARRDNSARGLTPTLNMLAFEIESDLGAAGFALKDEVFVGEFPTGSFNAQAVAVPGGVLILINTGLMGMVHKLTKIMALSFGFADLSSETRMRETFEAWSDYSENQITEMLAEVVLAYLVGGNVYSARRLPALGGLKGFVRAGICSECERFVIAHEYAHALLGHLDGYQPPKGINGSAGELQVIAKSWEQELEADVVAMQLMLTTGMPRLMFGSGPRLVDHPLKALVMQSVAAGALLFFAIDDLIQRVAEALYDLDRPSVVSDHPPSATRATLAREALRMCGGDQLLEVAGCCEAWMSGKAQDVAMFARDLCQRIVRSS